MRNKKLLTLSLVVALAFTACGKKTTTPETTPTPTETVTEENTSEEVVEEEVTEEDVVDEGVDMGEVVSNETLDKLHEAVLEKFGDDYVANMPFPAQTIEELFGVKADWYDAAIAEGPMMSVHVDKFIAIHATEGNLENVQNALNNYRETLLADTMQYPMNLTKIQGCVVETVGDYVILSLLGMVDDTAYENDEQIIEAYQTINNEVIELAKGIIE